MSAKVIRLPVNPRQTTPAAHPTQNAGVTYSTLERHYPGRREAHEYLASRGFLFLPPFGWANGRWRARVDVRDDDDVVVLVSIATANAA